MIEFTLKVLQKEKNIPYSGQRIFRVGKLSFKRIA